MLPVLISSSSSRIRNPDHTELALRQISQVARSLGWKSVEIGGEIDVRRIPPLRGARVLYSGVVPSSEQTREIEAAVCAAGGELIQPAQASVALTDFRRWYPSIAHLTARSVVVEPRDEMSLAQAEALGFPLFTKGLVKSRKERGWDACVIRDSAELQKRYEAAREPFVVRELLPLRAESSNALGFPQAREYRCFWVGGELAGSGPYWERCDPAGRIGPAEVAEFERLGREAHSQLGEPPLVAIDIAQLEENSWKIIEVGDPQHSLLSQINPTALLQKISEL